MITVVGLVFDIIGAWLLILGEVRGNAAFLRYQGSGDGKAWFEQHVKDLVWYKQWPLKLGVKLGSKNITAMGQEDLFDAFPRKAWAVFFLIIGFALQAIGSFGCQK
jgi:hypothetical protein